MNRNRRHQLYPFLAGALAASVVLLTIFGFYGRSVTKKIEVHEQKVVQDTALLNSLSETMHSMASAFRFVSPAELPEGAGNVDYRMEKRAFEHKEYVDKLFGATFPGGPSGDHDKDANAVYNTALNTVTDMEMTVTLVPSSVNHRKLMDGGTSLILGELCRRAGFSMVSTLVWDLKNRTFWVENEFPAGAEKPLSVIAGEKSSRGIDPRQLVRQSGDYTVTFPFRFDLMSSREVYPTGRNLDIPVGGYYVNFFSVYAKGSWRLEYAFPKSVDIDKVNLKAFAMNPGVTVKKIFPGGNRVVFEFGRAGMREDNVIVFGDAAALPLLVSARLIQR